MEITNENQGDTPMLTKADLALASFALAETFNSYLTAYKEEDHEGAEKEEMETSMDKIRMAFIKFDSILTSMNKEEDEAVEEEESEAEKEEE